MTIELGRASVVRRVWFVGWPGGDWLGVLYRSAPAADWEFKSRVRRHAPGGGSPWDGNDTKSWAGVTILDPDGVEVAVEALNELAGEIALERRAQQVDAFDVNGGPELFQKLLSARPWAFVREEER